MGAVDHLFYGHNDASTIYTSRELLLTLDSLSSKSDRHVADLHIREGTCLAPRQPDESPDLLYQSVIQRSSFLHLSTSSSASHTSQDGLAYLDENYDLLIRPTFHQKPHNQRLLDPL